MVGHREPDDYDPLRKSLEALSDSGVGRPLPLPPVWLPPVWINSGLLCWGLKKWETPREAKMPNFNRLLPDFVALAKAAEKRILEFAQKYGPLRLCEKHYGPVFHAPGCDTETCYEPREPGKGASEQKN